MVHEEPSPLRMTPLAPTAQTLMPLLGSLAHTPVSLVAMPEFCAAHAVPFHFWMVPLSPTAQTSLALLPPAP